MRPNAPAASALGRMAAWLGVVLLGTGLAGMAGQLPGVEPQPYIFRFHEDKPNPVYRRVCYTFAWNAILTFALLNLAGLTIAVVSGAWYLRQIYDRAYLPLAGLIWLLGICKALPRVHASTKGEAHERRYFYGLRVQVVVTVEGLPVEFCILPGSLADLHGLAELPLCLPAGAHIAADAAESVDTYFDGHSLSL